MLRQRSTTREVYEYFDPFMSEDRVRAFHLHDARG